MGPFAMMDSILRRTPLEDVSLDESTAALLVQLMHEAAAARGLSIDALLDEAEPPKSYTMGNAKITPPSGPEPAPRSVHKASPERVEQRKGGPAKPPSWLKKENPDAYERMLAAYNKFHFEPYKGVGLGTGAPRKAPASAPKRSGGSFQNPEPLPHAPVHAEPGSPEAEKFQAELHKALHTLGSAPEEHWGDAEAGKPMHPNVRNAMGLVTHSLEQTHGGFRRAMGGERGADAGAGKSKASRTSKAADQADIARDVMLNLVKGRGGKQGSGLKAVARLYAQRHGEQPTESLRGHPLPVVDRMLGAAWHVVHSAKRAGEKSAKARSVGEYVRKAAPGEEKAKLVAPTGVAGGSASGDEGGSESAPTGHEPKAASGETELGTTKTGGRHPSFLSKKAAHYDAQADKIDLKAEPHRAGEVAELNARARAHEFSAAARRGLDHAIEAQGLGHLFGGSAHPPGTPEHGQESAGKKKLKSALARIVAKGVHHLSHASMEGGKYRGQTAASAAGSTAEANLAKHHAPLVAHAIKLAHGMLSTPSGGRRDTSYDLPNQQAESVGGASLYEQVFGQQRSLFDLVMEANPVFKGKFGAYALGGSKKAVAGLKRTAAATGAGEVDDEDEALLHHHDVAEVGHGDPTDQMIANYAGIQQAALSTTPMLSGAARRKLMMPPEQGKLPKFQRKMVRTLRHVIDAPGREAPAVQAAEKEAAEKDYAKAKAEGQPAKKKRVPTATAIAASLQRKRGKEAVANQEAAERARKQLELDTRQWLRAASGQATKSKSKEDKEAAKVMGREAEPKWRPRGTGKTPARLPDRSGGVQAESAVSLHQAIFG